MSRVNRPATAFSTSRRAKEVGEVRAPNHLEWIASLPSVISGRSGCQAAHISFADRRFGKPERGKSKKADDMWVLPLTPEEHEDQHACRNGGERDWWERHKIDATTLAARLWAVSGDTEAAMLIMTTARSVASI